MLKLADIEACPLALKYQYIDGVERRPSEVMFRGLYFEHGVIGGTRGGQVPVYPKLKRGGDPAAKIELDALIVKARAILRSLRILPGAVEAQVQPELYTDRFIIHPDLIYKDFLKPERRAIYDLKYTETAIDDRWRGWADFDSMRSAQFQAIHYVSTYHELTGDWVPFYFLVFAKPGWVKVIKVEVTELGLQRYTTAVEFASARLAAYQAEGWRPRPEFNKCAGCAYYDICPERAVLPEVEVFEV